VPEQAKHSKELSVNKRDEVLPGKAIQKCAERDRYTGGGG
jgi:hypothetical protein